MRALRPRLGPVLVVAALVAGCSSDDGAADAPERSATEAASSSASTPSEPGDEGDVVPGEEWVVADPADHGIDPAGLEAARAYAFAPGKNTQGVVVVHEGEIVAEWYADGAGPESWTASWSVAKSFTSAAVGIAIEEGHIGGVEDPMSDYLPEWVGTGAEGITIRDVLQMTSGLEWNEAYDGSAGDSHIVQMVTGEADHLAYARARPAVAEPGTVWNYSSGDSMLLSGVVEEATGQPLDAYAAEVLFDPIGMEVEWWRDLEGHTLGYCCLDSTTRDLARLGLLYARNGRWGDEQVVPEQWVADSLEPAAPSEEGSYGYQWWLDDPEGVPADHFSANGHDGQFIDVMPSLDLVIVRNGTYVKDPGPAIADPTLFSRYPSDGIIPGRGTLPPDDWDGEAFLAPIVAAVPDA